MDPSSILGDAKVCGPPRPEFDGRLRSERKHAHIKVDSLQDHWERQNIVSQTRSHLGEVLHQEARLAVLWLASSQHEGDYLLPLPSENLKGCVYRELRWDTTYALQRRVMRLFGQGVGISGRPIRGETSFSPLQRLSMSRRVTGTCWEDGWPRRAIGTTASRRSGFRWSKTSSRRLSRTEPTAIRSLKQMRWRSSLSVSSGKVQAKNSKQSMSRCCRVEV